MKPEKKQPTGMYLALAALVFGFLIFSAATNKEPATPTTAEVEAQKVGSKTDAIWAAQHYVSQRLKNPADAKFAKQSESTIAHLGAGKWRVVSAVTAENSFGGHVLTRYEAVLQFSGKPSDYQLVSLKM